MNIGYSTELTIGQYQLLESLLPPPAATGRPRTVNMMLVIQGILYVLARVVAANVAERDGAKQLLSQVYSQPHRVRRLVRIWVDAGFSGAAFLQSIMDLFGLILDVVLRPQERQGFVLLPRRWVVSLVSSPEC